MTHYHHTWIISSKITFLLLSYMRLARETLSTVAICLKNHTWYIKIIMIFRSNGMFYYRNVGFFCRIFFRIFFLWSNLEILTQIKTQLQDGIKNLPHWSAEDICGSQNMIPNTIFKNTGICYWLFTFHLKVISIVNKIKSSKMHCPFWKFLYINERFHIIFPIGFE